MATSESRAPADVPNLYDGLAGIVALSILAWAFLYAFQPIFGLLLTVAFGSAYAAGRIDDLEHGVVVAGLWGFVIASVWFIGTFLSFGVAAILAVIGYGYWRGAW
ncbi:Duffy blood group [Halobacterium sp. KA-4]|uniref:Duffy blood group n=1 Tax=Halobacterium sp. KA-4 TaxID=2896367 RepID=UPI001E597371|nr:Duffy blood group [Halobacterium sp. KA-4]MCD2201333.1 Duffy blood group [Halobacterium sp. KA-4]